MCALYLTNGDSHWYIFDLVRDIGLGQQIEPHGSKKIILLPFHLSGDSDTKRGFGSIPSWDILDHKWDIGEKQKLGK